MADDSIPKAPTGTRAAGKRLWDAVLADYVLEQHELGLLREVVRTTDVLDELDAVIRRDGLIVAGPGGADRVHPAAVEARQARIALARLSAALRLPAGEEGDAQKDARRPQRRVGARGVYRIKGVAG